MKKNTNILMLMFNFSAVLLAAGTVLAAPVEKGEKTGEVLFKIHDVVPEKDADGKVLYCNIGATFFNNTSMDIANASINLSWEDEVIGETIDQEERSAKEQKRTNSKAARPRYTTSGFTGKNISTSIKLPQLKVKQQVSLKTKVDTDRCFLLLNDMDINVSNCGTASMNDKVSRQGCGNLFRYINPKSAEYYTEFKEISPDEMKAIEDAEVANIQNELNKLFSETVNKIKEITADAKQDIENGTIVEE